VRTSFDAHYADIDTQVLVQCLYFQRKYPFLVWMFLKISMHEMVELLHEKICHTSFINCLRICWINLLSASLINLIIDPLTYTQNLVYC